MDRQPCMIDILSAGEKLFHVRTRITDIARRMSEALRVGETPSTDLLEELRCYLAAENSSKLELALTLELQTLEKGEAYEVSCN